MQIVLDVTTSAEGRLSGTIRLAERQSGVPFVGTLELLGRIEEICCPAGSTRPEHT